MAVFVSPVDAISASLDMLAAVDALNRGLARREIVLKIGVHSGAAIAVTLNDRLDYFGQTVNLAARIQGLAEADEICFSDEVHAAEGMPERIRSLHCQSEKAEIKGVHDTIQVHRLRGHTLIAVA